MSAPDAVLRKVRQWLAFADEDLRLAQHGLTIAIETAERVRVTVHEAIHNKRLALPLDPTP